MKAQIVVDLGFGDAGKGTTVDYLSRRGERPLNVRFSGGAQAAHNVVTPDGRHHTFRQFGSGTLAGAQTFLSRFMLVQPSALLFEADKLEQLGVVSPLCGLFVSVNALLILPWHAAATRLREVERGDKRHGSTGCGISECQRDFLAGRSLLVGDLLAANLREKLRASQAGKLSEMKQLIELDSQTEESFDPALIDRLVKDYDLLLHRGASIVSDDHLAQLADQSDVLVFEGSQGVLLDEWFGFHPYTTWSTTTDENARRLLAEIGESQFTRVGVLRAYQTRHGAGPFPTESASFGESVPELHNKSYQWAGDWRSGPLDLVLSQYAVTVNRGIDQLVLTHLDRRTDWTYADAYALPKGRDLGDFEVRDGCIVGIKPGEKDQLERQERLARLLFQCQPIYRPAVGDSTLVGQVEAALSAPVALLSYGPRATDKVAQRSTRGAGE